MAKKGHSSHMTRLENILGGVFFVIYLLVMPFVTEPLFSGLEHLLGMPLSEGMRQAIYYYTIFALTVIIFWIYLGHTTASFMSSALRTLGHLFWGLVGFYGLNELSYRLLQLLPGSQVNLNDRAISAQLGSAPHGTVLIIVFLAPFVEEVLFRGYVFGNLRVHNKAAAYIVSCLLFAFLHVWQFAVVEQSLGYFLLMLQYLVPGLVFAWCYDRSGTLWGSILLHMAVNGMAVLGMM